MKFLLKCLDKFHPRHSSSKKKKIDLGFRKRSRLFTLFIYLYDILQRLFCEIMFNFIFCYAMNFSKFSCKMIKLLLIVIKSSVSIRKGSSRGDQLPCLGFSNSITTFFLLSFWKQKSWKTIINFLFLFTLMCLKIILHKGFGGREENHENNINFF